MLCDDIHTHERKPGNQNPSVQRNPIQLQQCFVGKQIHADHAYNEKRDDRRGNGFQ